MEVSKEFTDNVRNYVTIDNKIKSAQEAIKALKKEKEKAENNIMIYIKTYELDEQPINITGGRLQMALSKRTASISRKYVEQRLTEYFKSNTKAQEVTSFIFDNREVVEKEVLRRRNNRKPK